MAERIEKAVLLAAGRGTRMGEITQDDSEADVAGAWEADDGAHHGPVGGSGDSAIFGSGWIPRRID